LPREVVREQDLLRRQMIEDVSKKVYNVIIKIKKKGIKRKSTSSSINDIYCKSKSRDQLTNLTMG
jgi:hypothetical protein